MLFHPYRLQCASCFQKIDTLLYNHNTIIIQDIINNDVLAPDSSVHNQIPLIISKMSFYNRFKSRPKQLPTLHLVVMTPKSLLIEDSLPSFPPAID